MTKQEAIESMREGNRLTHITFTSDEWITLKGNIIVTEEGYECFQEEFWKYRPGANWETGWSIWPGTLAQYTNDSKNYLDLAIQKKELPINRLSSRARKSSIDERVRYFILKEFKEKD